MSFGFSPSDVFALIQLAKTTYDDCRRAPEHFSEAGRGAKSLHLVFQSLQSEVENPSSLLNRNEDYRNHIADIANNCKVVLNQLDAIVRKHSSLGTSKIKALDRFRFPRKEVLEIQGKLRFHESHLITYLETIGVSALGRVEQKFEVAGKSHEEVMDGLAKILGKVDKIAAEIRVGMHPESQFSDHTDDEKPVWRALRRKLIGEGITSKLIQRFEDRIVERVKEMNDFGLLDSEAPTETSDDAGFDTETPMPSSIKIKAVYQPPEVMTDTESGWDSEATLPERPSKLEVRRKVSCGTIMNQRRRRAWSNGNSASRSNVAIPSIVPEEQVPSIAPQDPVKDSGSGEKTVHSASPKIIIAPDHLPAQGASELSISNGMEECEAALQDDKRPLDEGISMQNFDEIQDADLLPQGIAELEGTEVLQELPHRSTNSADSDTIKDASSPSHSPVRAALRRSPESLGWSTPRDITPPPKYSRSPEPRGRFPPRMVQLRSPIGPILGAESRIWTGVDSRLKLKAKFVSFDGDYVRLVESDGGETIIFASKLSQPDLDYIESLRANIPAKEQTKALPEVSKTVKFDDTKEDKPKTRRAILNAADPDIETVRPERPEILTGERTKWRPVWRYRKLRTLPLRQEGFHTNELPLAASQGNLSKVQKLLGRGAFVDWDGEKISDSEGGTRQARTTTGLHRAAKAGHFEVAQLLLDYGASPDNRAILKVLASNGNAEMIRLLLEYDADTERTAASSDYSTALHVACEKGHRAVVEVLLEFGADIEARDRDHETPLYHAAMNNRCRIAKILLREGADTTIVAEDGQTCLYKAAGRGYEDMVRALLSYGADPSLGRGVSGETALYKAARKGYTEVVYLLLQYGADPNLPNDTKDWAAGSTMDTIIWLLRPEENPRNVYGQGPLYIAAQQGYGEIVGMLINHGAEVNAKTKQGETAIYAAAAKAHKGVVAMLFKHGATLAPQEEVDIVTKLMDPNNQEPEVMKHVQKTRTEIISMLLSRMSTKRILRGLETWRNGESIPGLDMIGATIRSLGA
jgi:ankyrin repeat protein